METPGGILGEVWWAAAGTNTVAYQTAAAEPIQRAGGPNAYFAWAFPGTAPA